jgi:hypothetical protein
MSRYTWFSLSLVLLLGLGTAPGIIHAQSSSDNQATQALQKELQELRDQMNKVQAQLDELQAQRTQEPQRAPAPSSTSGAIESTKPPLQGPTSKHVGEATSTYVEFNEDTQAAARYDNVPLDSAFRVRTTFLRSADISKLTSSKI